MSSLVFCVLACLLYKCLFNRKNSLEKMAGLMNYISPNDPNGIYKLAKWCAMLGSVGTLIATLIRDWVRAANEHRIDFTDCNSKMITEFNSLCLQKLFAARRVGNFGFEISHMVIMILSMLSCISYFAMEDLYSAHEGSGFMTTCLLVGTVLEVMKSAFGVGTRIASGRTSYFFPPNEQLKVNTYPAMQMGYSMIRNCFTWVTFLRDTILAIGIYLAYVYDSEINVIGGNWRFLGLITAVIGIVNTVFEFLKVINFNFWYEKSDFTYYAFLICFTFWLFMFGLHCDSLVTGEEKGMLDEASSGAEVSDDNMEEEEQPEEAPKKKRKHHRKHQESEDDV